MIILSINACHLSDDSYHLTRTDKMLNFQFNKPCANAFNTMLYTLEVNGESFLYTFNGLDSCIDIKNIDSDKERKIELADFLNKRTGYDERYGCYLHLDDLESGWIDSGFSDSIYHLNFSSGIVDKIIFKHLSGGYRLYDMMSQFYVEGDKLLMRLYHPNKDITFGLFISSTDSLELKKELGHLPQIYREKNMYIDEGALTILSKDSFIISYHYSDSVDLYVNYEFVERKAMKSNYSKEFMGYNAASGDANALSEHYLMHQRYDYIFYDANKQLFYRVFVHGNQTDGVIQMSEYWSLCVFDRSFSLIHEELFKNSEFEKGDIFLSGSSIYLANSSKSIFAKWGKPYSKIVFDEFKLEKKNS